MNTIEIQAASTKELVELYNRLTGANIKKFENRRIAEKRTQEAVDASSKESVVKAAADIIKPEEVVDVTVTFGDGSTMDFKEPAEKKSRTKKANTEGASVGPKRTGLPGPNSPLSGKKIQILVKENPRREGTHGHKSFALMWDGMTYEEYRLKGGRSNDLNWDIAHGYVKMV